VAAALAERALTLPGDGEVEIDALLGWLAGLGMLAGVGLAAGALVLLGATTSAGTVVVGLVAGAVLAVVPAVLARRRLGRGGRRAG
jgi:2-keto-4-pentenoate hydratase